MTLRTIEIGTWMPPGFIICLFSLLLYVLRGAQIYKESKWWTRDFKVLLIILLHRILLTVEMVSEIRESHKKQKEKRAFQKIHIPLVFWSQTEICHWKQSTEHQELWILRQGHMFLLCNVASWSCDYVVSTQCLPPVTTCHQRMGPHIRKLSGNLCLHE